MVDALGGIEMSVPANIRIDSQLITPGTHFYNGNMILTLVRERHSLGISDYGRRNNNWKL